MLAIRRMPAPNSRLQAKTPGQASTSLHHAADQGHTETVEVLLARGADTSAVDREGNTPLHLASLEGHTATAGVLLDDGADTEAKRKLGYTALHLASGKGHAETAGMLLDHGADPTAELPDGKTAHSMANGAVKSDVALMKRLKPPGKKNHQRQRETERAAAHTATERQHGHDDPDL